MKLSNWLGAAALALSFGTAGAASATTFLGHTVSAEYVWPDVDTTLYSGGVAVVDSGLEFPDFAGFGPGALTIDFSANQIHLVYALGWGLAGGGTFDGWKFTDLTSSNITGVSLIGTNLDGFTAANLSFDSNRVYADTLGLGGWGNGTFITIGVEFASAVPEPATWAMMIVGFGAAGSMVRTSRRRNAFEAV